MNRAPRSVEELITSFGRPMTTYEILWILEKHKGRKTIYKEINNKIKYGIFRDFVLDFTPYYERKVRLIGLNIGKFKIVLT